MNLEVQWASEAAIAAVEKAGGRIRIAYYDAAALEAAVDPEKWFLSGAKDSSIIVQSEFFLAFDLHSSREKILFRVRCFKF